MSSRLSLGIKKPCEYSVGGVDNVYIVRRDLIHHVNNADNNPNLIDGFVGFGGAGIPWLEFGAVRALTTAGESISFSKNGTSFPQQITLIFAKIEWLKRAALEQLINDTVVCVFRDRQKKWWYIGKEHGLKVSKYTSKVQESRKANGYAITLSGTERYQMYEVSFDAISADIAVNDGAPVIFDGAPTPQNGGPITTFLGGSGTNEGINENLSSFIGGAGKPMSLYKLGNYAIGLFL